jgi:hypothetical protein
MQKRLSQISIAKDPFLNNRGISDENDFALRDDYFGGAAMRTADPA